MGMSGYIMDLEEDFVEEVSKRIGDLVAIYVASVSRNIFNFADIYV